MYNVELAIRDYLTLKGVDTFWIDSAMNYIRQGMVSNAYFATNLLTQRVTVTRGRVSAYRATFMATFPDTQRKEAMTLRYACDPARKVPHKLRVTTAKAGTEGTA